MPDFLPRRDDDLLMWMGNVEARLNADAGRYGLTAADAADFAAAVAAYRAALRLALAPETRTSPAVIDKNDRRAELVAVTRRLVRTVRGTASVGGVERAELGLPVPAGRRKRVPPPEAAPFVEVREVRGAKVKVLLRAPEQEGAGKPADAAGARLLVCVGEEAPMNAAAWRFGCNTTSPRCTVDFGGGLRPGTKVWLTACWLSPTAEAGPSSAPTYTYLTHAGPRQTGGVVREAA